MYKKKYIQYITRVPFSVIFFIFRCNGAFARGRRSYFLKDWTGRSWRGPSVLWNFPTELRCILCCCHDNALPTSTAPCAGQKMGPEFHQLHSLLSIQGNNNNNNTDVCKLYATKWQTLPLFWNCVCKSYIFTCRLLLFCVLEICCIGFFVKRWKSKNSVCVEKMCHIENVVRSKSSEIIFVLFLFFLLLFFFNILFISVGDMFEGFEGGIGNHKRYMIFV